MTTALLTINDFSGGISTDETAQASNAFQAGVEVDIHDRVGILRPSFTLAQESTTTALVTAIDSFDGDGTDKLYGFDGSLIYQRTGTTWATDRTLSGTTALTDTPTMVKWNDAIYYATKNDVGRLTGTTYDDDYLTTVLSGTLPAQDAAWKPMKSFLDSLFIGDGRFVSSISTAPVFTQKALTLPLGFRIRDMEVIGDRLAIACGGDSATAGDSSKSTVFFWDGTSALPESRVEVDAIGGIQSIKNIDNILYLFTRNVAPPQPAGIDIYFYNGSDFDLLKTIPNAPGDTDSCRMYPNAVANYNNNLLVGTTRVSGGTNQNHGVWKWGRANRDFPRSLVLDNLTSDDEQSDVTIGSIFVFGDQYFVANKTGSTFRIDALSTTVASSAAYIESQVYELTNDEDPTLVKGVKIFAKPMPASTTVVVKYALDGAAFSTLGTITSANQNDILWGIQQRADIIELRIEMTSNGVNRPEIYKISLY
jgi:hypothetical protein